MISIKGVCCAVTCCDMNEYAETWNGLASYLVKGWNRTTCLSTKTNQSTNMSGTMKFMATFFSKELWNLHMFHFSWSFWHQDDLIRRLWLLSIARVEWTCSFYSQFILFYWFCFGRQYLQVFPEIYVYLLCLLFQCRGISHLQDTAVFCVFL